MAIDCHSLEPIRSKQGEILTTTLENVPMDFELETIQKIGDQLPQDANLD
jgi:hypothetical protein